MCLVAKQSSVLFSSVSHVCWCLKPSCVRWRLCCVLVCLRMYECVSSCLYLLWVCMLRPHRTNTFQHFFTQPNKYGVWLICCFSLIRNPSLDDGEGHRFESQHFQLRWESNTEAEALWNIESSTDWGYCFDLHVLHSVLQSYSSSRIYQLIFINGKAAS